jgi:hypothetical protein
MADDYSKVVSPPPIAQVQDSRPREVTNPRRDINDLEVVELSRIRTDYRRATASYHTASVRTSTGPPTGLRWLKHAVSKFWRSQISMVVAHEACRDHLGTSAIQ